MYEIGCYWTKLLPIGIDGENIISCSVSKPSPIFGADKDLNPGRPSEAGATEPAENPKEAELGLAPDPTWPGNWLLEKNIECDNQCRSLMALAEVRTPKAKGKGGQRACHIRLNEIDRVITAPSILTKPAPPGCSIPTIRGESERFPKLPKGIGTYWINGQADSWGL